jgi:ribonuclease R
MGDAVRIKVVAANLSKRQLDYEWVTEKQPGDNREQGKKVSAVKGKASTADRSKQKAGKKKK